MTVLFLSRFFYPHIGGVERHVEEISKRLIKMGHEVVVVSESSTSEESPPTSSKLWRGHHPRCFKAYKIPVGENEKLKKFQIWRWLWRHRQLIKQADIIHCHDVFFWYLPFRFLYPQKPVFTTFHGYETKFPPSKKAIFVRKLSEKLSFGNICVGDYIKKWYRTNSNFTTYGGVRRP